MSDETPQGDQPTPEPSNPGADSPVEPSGETDSPPVESAGLDAEAATEAALQAAQDAVATLGDEAAGGDGAPLNLPSLDPETAADLPDGLSLLSDVRLNVAIELGRTRMLVEDVLKLGSGAVVELDKLAGDPVDVFVNERLVARGEVLVLNDNFCIRISEILSPIASLNGAAPASAVAAPPDSSQ